MWAGGMELLLSAITESKNKLISLLWHNDLSADLPSRLNLPILDAELVVLRATIQICSNFCYAEVCYIAHSRRESSARYVSHRGLKKNVLLPTVPAKKSLWVCMEIITPVLASYMPLNDTLKVYLSWRCLQRCTYLLAWCHHDESLTSSHFALHGGCNRPNAAYFWESSLLGLQAKVVKDFQVIRVDT